MALTFGVEMEPALLAGFSPAQVLDEAYPSLPARLETSIRISPLNLHTHLRRREHSGENRQRRGLVQVHTVEVWTPAISLPFFV